MSDLPVLLFRERGVDRATAEGVAALINGEPGPIRVSVIDTEVPLANGDEAVQWQTIFAAIAAVRRTQEVGKGCFVHLLMISANESNWFAAEDENCIRNSFGHVGDFRWLTTAPDTVIGANYVCKAVVNALVTEAGTDWRSLWHDEPRGCFFDFCEIKEQATLRLRTGDLCTGCLEVLQGLGLPDALIRQIVRVMDRSRRAALGAAQFLPAAPVTSEDLPFPVAVTRHRAVHAREATDRFIQFIRHFDCLVRYTYLTTCLAAGETPTIVERPSLGWWVDWLRATTRFREAVDLIEREHLVSIRNESLAHGWAKVDPPTAARVESTVQRLEELLRPALSAHRLVILRHIGLSNGQYVVSGDLLHGSNVLPQSFAATLRLTPTDAGLRDEDVVHLANKNMTTFHSAAPYIQSRICPECNHERLLITDGEQYIDVFMGHRVTL